MPANVSPDYRLAEARYREAATLEDKLAALEEMLATIPKHKGTEKMQADIKRRISRTKDTILQGKKAVGGRQRTSYTVKREGAGQVALVGPANSGKSSILKVLSNADPDVADYPYTTQTPQPGMAAWENVMIQVVDLPPYDPELSPQWLMGAIRSADGLAVVLSLASDDILEETERTFGLLARQKTWLSAGTPPPAGEGGPLSPLVVGSREIVGPPLFEALSADEDGDSDDPPRLRRWPAIIVANKLDAPGAAERLELVREICPALTVVAVSATQGWGLDELRGWLFGLLDKIRVYTRAPGKKVDMSAPFTIPRGSTLIEAAAAVHKDFAANLKSARVWGRRTFDGQLVPKDYIVEDGDVVELKM
jgi:ribosome-interacting GTPase 1